MRVLVVHNHYQQAGGEDSVFTAEVDLLRSSGHEVTTLEETNDLIRGTAGKIGAAVGVVYNREGRRRVAEMIARDRPDVVHFHNLFPRLSPAVFWACEDASVPAVWTLHNFRIVCAAGFLFRDGHPCEDCIAGSVMNAVRHRCYRGSAIGSAAVAAMIAGHRQAGTWHRKVGRFIALTEFARDRLVAAGLPPDRVVVKPNFVRMVDHSASTRERHGAVFVGRMSYEKGPRIAIEAWRRLPHLTLTMIGDGPELAALKSAAPSNVIFLGALPRDEAFRQIATSQALIMPSIWFENYPMTVVEAFALGTPVIASRIGALRTIVTDHVNGLHFEPGDPIDLARVVGEGFANYALLEGLGRGAREKSMTELSPEANLARLIEIYEQARRA